jgi:hypothetical protein
VENPAHRLIQLLDPPDLPGLSDVGGVVLHGQFIGEHQVLLLDADEPELMQVLVGLEPQLAGLTQGSGTVGDGPLFVLLLLELVGEGADDEFLLGGGRWLVVGTEGGEGSRSRRGMKQLATALSITNNNMALIKEFIVDEGVPADVALDEEPNDQPEELLEDEGDEEDVSEVYKVEQQQELVPAQQHVVELQPLVTDQHRHLLHRGHVQRAARQPVQQRLPSHVHRRHLHALQVVFEALLHGVADLLQVL